MIDRQRLKQMLGNDEQLAERVISEFRPQAQNMLLRIKSAQSDANWEEVELAAHDLKNYFNYLGLFDAAECCSRLELNVADLAETQILDAIVSDVISKIY